MRSLPNFKILVAADVEEAKSMMGEMMSHQGPVYLRLGRDMATDIYDGHKQISIGGSDLLREGNDVTLVACGLMVNKAMEAAKILAQKNISASVINAYSIKPLDEKKILEEARKTSAFVSIEDHSVIGGLGSALAELLAKNYPIPMEFIGMQDKFGESGDPEELYDKYGFTPSNIVAATEKVISRKSGWRLNRDA